MSQYANKTVEQAKAWIGKNEADGSHHAIIDIYNSHTPLARGYRMTYTDDWCAAFVSAVAVKLGYTDIIPTECSCTRMIDLLKTHGSFVENDAYVPKAGDIIFYDWDDSGRGDNKSSPDHVGIVEKVQGGVITVIEGNYKNAVARREIAVNGKFIRGYGVPSYDSMPTAEENNVLDFQKAALADGLTLPRYGADGEWGSETAAVAAVLILRGSVGERVRFVQRRLTALGYDLGKAGVDGIFGEKTENAVRAFQAKRNLDVDGIVGIQTMKILAGVTA